MSPVHPPLTHVAVGAYTIGTAMLVLGALGFEEATMARGARFVIYGGVLAAVLAVVPGVLDWLRLPKGSAARRTGVAHMIAVAVASTLYGVTAGRLGDGYGAGVVETVPLVLGVVAFAVLVVGGHLGGRLVFGYGAKVAPPGRDPATRKR